MKTILMMLLKRVLKIPRNWDTIILFSKKLKINQIYFTRIFRVARSQPGSSHGRSGGSFTPPLPRAISNTIMKISNRDNVRSPPVIKRNIFFFIIFNRTSSQYSAKDNIYTYYLKTRPILILQGIEWFVQCREN